MTRRIAKFLFALTIVAVIAIIAVAWGMVDYALTPDRMSDDEAINRQVARAPWIAEWVDSVRQSGTLHDTIITRPDGVKLHAWWLASSRPTTHTAIAVHGYKAQALDMIHIAYLYHHVLGYNVLLPDLYAHGHSDGTTIGMGWNDRLDLLRWVDVADTLFRGESPCTKIVLHGISMGAATVMNASGEHLPPCVKCIVEDCGYTSVWEEFSHEAKQQFGISEFPILYLASAVCRLRYGWRFGEASPLQQVKKCRIPMLFIHGDNDDFVPSPMVYPLFEAKNHPKEIFVTAGVPHARSYDMMPNNYTLRVREFVGKYID